MRAEFASGRAVRHHLDVPPIEPEVDPDVARLLTASRAAHRQYRLAANPAPPGIPNYPLAAQHVAMALELRQAAHDRDPDHTAPAWQEDPVSHAELVEFYTRYAETP